MNNGIKVMTANDMFLYGFGHITTHVYTQEFLQRDLKAFFKYSISIPAEVQSLPETEQHGLMIYRATFALAENLSNCLLNLSQNSVNYSRWMNETFKAFILIIVK